MPSRTPEATWVWLPGWTAGPDVFARQIARLPGTRHLPVDLGACSSPGEIRARVDETLARAGTAVRIVGWSLGAMVALDAVRRRGPGPVASLHLVGAAGRFVTGADGGAWPDTVLERMHARLRDDRAGLLADFRRRLFSRAELARGELERWEREQGPVAWTAQALAAGLSFLRTFSVYAHAGAVRLPVRLLHGARDAACPLAEAERLAGALPEAGLTVLGEAGHAPLFTEPETFHAWLTSDS